MTGPRIAVAARSAVAEGFAAATRRTAARHAAAGITDEDGRGTPSEESPAGAQDAPATEATVREIGPVASSGRHSAKTPALPPTLLHPTTYLCANCAGRFPARNRATPYCSPKCTAEAKAVRYARKQRAEYGGDLPTSVRILLHRKIQHAIDECGYDKWSGEPEPDPVTPPSVHPLAAYVDPLIPASDTYAVKAQELMVRSLSENVLLACDHQNWDTVWRAWVNLHAR